MKLLYLFLISTLAIAQSELSMMGIGAPIVSSSLLPGTIFLQDVSYSNCRYIH